MPHELELRPVATFYRGGTALVIRFVTAIAIWGTIATGAYAAGPNPGDPLFCQPQEGTTYLIVNGGTGVFTANSDCFNGNSANNTHLSITTGGGGSLAGTNAGGSTNYVYAPPTSTFVGLDTFSIPVTTVWNSAGGTGSAGGSSSPGGPATLGITLNVIAGAVTLTDTPNAAILIPVPAGSVTGCTAPGNAGHGPSATDVVGCVTSVKTGSGSIIHPTHGTLVTSGNTLRYTPTSGFVGIDTFTYQAFGVNTDGTSALSSGNVAVTMDVFNTIDLARPSYNASQLGVTLSPIFNGGTLVLDQSGASYSQAFTLDTSTTNTIDQAGQSATFSGVFSDATTGGNLVIANSGSGGTVTFSGVNGYTGTTTINFGATLNVTGSIASSSLTSVNNGGTLVGTGTVGQTQINSGGTFAPGAAGTPGTSMTVQGNLAFASGALYLVQLNPATSSFANVTGTATLAGNVLAAFAPGSYLQKQYTILQSAGLGGTTFAALGTTNLPAGIRVNLSYTPTNVLLNLTAALGIGGLNTNQQNVASGLNNFFNGGGTLPPSFLTVFGLTGGNLQAALTQLSGEMTTGSQETTFNAMTQFMGVMTDPFIDGRGETMPAPGAMHYADDGALNANAYAATGKARGAFAMFAKAPLASTYVPRWSAWAAGFGGTQSTSGDPAVGTNGATSRVYGTAVGADYRFSHDTIAGFALVGGGTGFSVANGGSGHSDLFQAGAFVRHTAGAAYVSGALAYGWQDVTTKRTVTVAGLDQLQAHFNPNAVSGRLEGGYRYLTPWTGGIGITPYAAAQFTTFMLPGYGEQAIVGANNFALSYAARSVTDTRSELGVRTDKSFALTNEILTLRSRLAWSHDFDPDHSIGATFQALPGASFIVNGAAQARDSALTTLSAELKWMNGWSAATTFDGEFSNVTSSYAGKGVVRYAW
jgi:uncharacterized protein with beta-barrel porin domain